MKQSFTYQPTYFFLSSLCITWVVVLIAAYISYHALSYYYLLLPLILLSMSSPSISALIMFYTSRDKNMWYDFLQRLSFTKIKKYFIPIIILFMPCLILLSIAISLLFGLSKKQFLLAHLAPDQALEGQSFLAILIIVLLSCSLEEIGWRGYGIDSLKSKYNLWNTSLIFAVIWSLWHVPSFFIKNGYFQQELWNAGIIQVFVYFMSLFPVTILINWAYTRNNRSILIAILSHATMNISYTLFQIEPYTKVILMVLLLIIAGLVVTKDKKIFFQKT